MSDFQVFFPLGIRHILNWQGYDHLLFILVLCCSYTAEQWRKILILITAFTAGHSLSLVMVFFQWIYLPRTWVETLIPITIALAAGFNLFNTKGKEHSRAIHYTMALVFGFIHGMGFASALEAILGKNAAVWIPLVSFNLGLEIGQLVVVCMTLATMATLVYFMGFRQEILYKRLSGIIFLVALVLVYIRVNDLYPNQAFSLNHFHSLALSAGLVLISCTNPALVCGQMLNNPGSNHGNRFEQLGPMLRSPNSYRTASGAPGPSYWQQRADYKIAASLNDQSHILTGTETITYYNRSPDPLSYIWIQLDENEHDPASDNQFFDGSKMNTVLSSREIENLKKTSLHGLGDKIEAVTDNKGIALAYTINQTMMRIELPRTLQKGEIFVLTIRWHYQLSERSVVGGRGGFEYFPEDGNYLYTVTQWYPRLAVYSDFQGWQNKQFTGTGEFALTFGNFDVQMTVPSDHLVGATGQCQNYAEVLSPAQFARWEKAQTARQPVEIVTLQEAQMAEKSRSKATKTWQFHAEHVRDFAWTSSRKFIWDGMGITVGGKKIMCMSFYGKEAYGLYRKFSTKVVAHTVKTYSAHTIPYPYPVAQSIEATSGMEYPMICFNYGRTEKDGSYSEATKHGMISVIIHEVGHNFFPMIVNSDERQWTWMDEGLNTFCQFMAEQEFDNHYPSSRGPAYKITDYMSLPKDQLEPIMTNSENINLFGANAYAKTATGLNILRETIMGRPLFDYAFKEYARRWAFKHPTPEDFFRTMEDASAVDLDWFWRGWFYGTDPVDISLDSVKYFTPDLGGQPRPKIITRKVIHAPPYDDVTRQKNRAEGIRFMVDTDTTLRDFYSGYKNYETTPTETLSSTVYTDTLSAEEKQKMTGQDHYYELSFSNKGGMVMPILIGWTYQDGTQEVDRIPAYIWRKNEHQLSKVFVKSKPVRSIRLDPMRETADINESNNGWPSISVPSHFELYKFKAGARGQSSGENPMQKAQKKN